MENKLVLFISELSYSNMIKFREHLITVCGISRGTYYNWRNGKTVPKIYFRQKINKLSLELFNKTIYEAKDFRRY
jgi:hypothetical protein